MKYTHRYLARLVVEAETPLAVGNGERTAMTDRLVATDVNGLPFIPGTALAGVLRSSVQIDNKDELFGFQNGENGKGSRLILSSAQLVGCDGKVVDGFGYNLSGEFYTNFKSLPIRQHVRISHKGAAEQGGKFDEQVVYKGTRFCFEMELVGNSDDEKDWKKILDEFCNPTFRIGGGTRKGFGAISVKEVKSEVLDLSNENELSRYLEKTSEINDKFWNSIAVKTTKKVASNWTEYELILTPDDFFLFGSGFGSDDGTADMSYVTEKVVDWSSGKGNFTEEKILIPATSFKGALAHRTAFHFNKMKGVYADKLKESGFCGSLIQKGYWIPDDCMNFNSNKTDDIFRMVTDGNPAVRALFGFSAKDEDGQRGNVVFSDVFLEPTKGKLLNHVAIDRFTGGAMEGALFCEEVVGSKESFLLKIWVKNDVAANYLKAFEAALNDLCTGMLPLGGGTMRGNGSFSGTITKNE